MKQLGILDSAFINLEQTNTPQHVGGLGIYDPSSAPSARVTPVPTRAIVASGTRRMLSLQGYMMATL